MDKINILKASVAGIFAGISSWLGWFGWLAVIFIISLTGDWLTGSAAAVKNGEWKSSVAREGLWHKTGCITAVLVAAIMDIVIGTAINRIPGLSLPFTYTVLLCPIAMTWYILTELGSIIENAGKMGAPVPTFLKKAISLFKGTVDAAGEKITDNKKL